jgi:hypothetical protein
MRRHRLSSIAMDAWRSVSTPAERRPVDVAQRANPLRIGSHSGEVVGNECFSELEVVHGSIVSC